jgi:hypothetical protein
LRTCLCRKRAGKRFVLLGALVLVAGLARLPATPAGQNLDMEGKRGKLLGLLSVGGLLVATASATTAPVPVKTSTRNENTPAADGVYLSWAKSRRGHPHVFDAWAQAEGSAPFKVNAPGTSGWSGGIDGTRLVYQQLRKRNSDIRFFDLATRRRSNPPAGVNTKRWEWRPTISGNWLLYGRGVVFGTSQFVILRNIVTGEQRVLDALQSKSGFLQAGQVAGNYAVWLKCTSRTTCKVFRYEIVSGTATQMPATGQVLYAPSVTPAGTTYYGRSGPACGASAQLVKTTIDGATVVLSSFPSGQDFSVTYADLVLTVPPSPPTPITTTRIYFDRAICSSNRSDIYSVTDDERIPPSYP